MGLHVSSSEWDACTFSSWGGSFPSPCSLTFSTKLTTPCASKVQTQPRRSCVRCGSSKLFSLSLDKMKPSSSIALHERECVNSSSKCTLRARVDFPTQVRRSVENVSCWVLGDCGATHYGDDETMLVQAFVPVGDVLDEPKHSSAVTGGSAGDYAAAIGNMTITSRGRLCIRGCHGHRFSENCKRRVLSSSVCKDAVSEARHWLGLSKHQWRYRGLARVSCKEGATARFAGARLGKKIQERGLCTWIEIPSEDRKCHYQVMDAYAREAKP